MTDLIGLALTVLLFAAALTVSVLSMPIVLSFIVLVTVFDIVARCLVRQYGDRG